ncbi:uncharacterized protein BDZ99DRAFT_467972 [Mytilinidion resinicola]|uniref:Uncharacterized protein n=1 Tax=Mytilinidion resinicola TaxID=574789 RepID=A0A6A6Y5G0_9PEZI|nr:uncharacterized protein BDZ99DRAFT_467972 [Mytilinidion resinicola]KAF2803859.1 hypothetical protein BDZ99DRAFT_467972 [Mytilinidion resinicola]
MALLHACGRLVLIVTSLLPPLPNTDAERCPDSPTSDLLAGSQCQVLQEGLGRVVCSPTAPGYTLERPEPGTWSPKRKWTLVGSIVSWESIAYHLITERSYN